MFEIESFKKVSASGINIIKTAYPEDILKFICPYYFIRRGFAEQTVEEMVLILMKADDKLSDNIKEYTKGSKSIDIITTDWVIIPKRSPSKWLYCSTMFLAATYNNGINIPFHGTNPELEC